MANTPGSILKLSRESKKLNIAQVVKGTRIRAIYIHALEADNYQMLPSSVQLKGFLRIYAEFLELNSHDVMSLLPSEYQPEEKEITHNTELEINQSDSIDTKNLPPSDKPTLDDLQLEANASPPETIEEYYEPVNAGKVDASEALEEALENQDQDNRAAEIFSSIGSQLQNRRELLGISIKEVEANTHVLRRYLESIENGRFDNLETTVQTKGMLSNYAQFLDMDVDEILLQYAEGLQLQREEGLDKAKLKVKVNLQAIGSFRPSNAFYPSTLSLAVPRSFFCWYSSFGVQARSLIYIVNRMYKRHLHQFLISYSLPSFLLQNPDYQTINLLPY